MDRRKTGNSKQILSAYRIVFCGGPEDGKRGVLVHNGALEVCFNESNALDVVWVRYAGVNLSFLSKNGLNDNRGTFAANFEGGFLYTCGLDNVSTCVKGLPVHGSLHAHAAQNVRIDVGESTVTVSGEVANTALFGENIVLKRQYIVGCDKLTVCDTVQNAGFTPVSYAVLYHTNFGYPFLDEGLQIEMPDEKAEPLTPLARSRMRDRLRITPPEDGGTEDVYYHYLRQGVVRLTNATAGVSCELRYETADFPVTLVWRSMVSGDYALGIEPSTTRFDTFAPRELPPAAEKQYKIEYSFGTKKE